MLPYAQRSRSSWAASPASADNAVRCSYLRHGRARRAQMADLTKRVARGQGLIAGSGLDKLWQRRRRCIPAADNAVCQYKLLFSLLCRYRCSWTWPGQSARCRCSQPSDKLHGVCSSCCKLCVLPDFSCIHAAAAAGHVEWHTDTLAHRPGGRCKQTLALTLATARTAALTGGCGTALPKRGWH